MIFIGPELSDPHAHFITNIVECVGTDNDLIIDLYDNQNKEEIFHLISEHVLNHRERFVIYNAYEDEDFFLTFAGHFPELTLIIVFSDDEWRHANYDRYLALYADRFTIAVLDNIKLYREYGLEPTYMQWACNPKKFHPLFNRKKKYDISFIGAAYGKRIDYVRYLLEEGIDVRVFGRGWNRVSGMAGSWGGYLTHEQMLEVISQSRINLNFLWTSANPERATIKGRTMELAACKAFQLSNDTDEFENYGFVDCENIAVFNDKASLLSKVRYYLAHDAEREAIAARAYEYVLRHHTWDQRFNVIFDEVCGQKFKTSNNRTYRILVIVREGITHRLHHDDERLNLQFLPDSASLGLRLDDFDGVIRLERNSTLNNDALFMMAFGLMVDRADVSAANFNVCAGQERYWIRFRDKYLERKPTLLRILPTECIMFSSGYVINNGFAMPSDINQINFSYVEYPAFSIVLPYMKKRILRLCFAHHHEARKRFRTYIENGRIASAIALATDKVWQRYFSQSSGRES